MRAGLITGAGTYEVTEVPTPRPADHGVVVDVTYCGLCGTDIHAFTSGRPYTPAICGHEWTGTISAVGGSVTSRSVGDRVVVGVPPPCGSCESCLAGHPRQCLVAAAFARGRDPDAPPHGGFAPQIAVHADRVIAARPELDDEALAQVEPVTVSVHAVNQSRVAAGDLAVVLGAGPVGLTTMQCALAAGAGRAIAVEPDGARRALAADLGAAATASPETAADVVAELSDGFGADVVYECAGAPSTLTLAAELVRRGGSICVVGLHDGPVSVEPSTWLRKELTITTALAYVHEEFETAMDHLVNGRVHVDRLHTATTSLDGLGETLDDFGRGGSSQLKVLVKPDW